MGGSWWFYQQKLCKRNGVANKKFGIQKLPTSGFMGCDAVSLEDCPKIGI
jgi:hypothetical protein